MDQGMLNATIGLGVMVAVIGGIGVWAALGVKKRPDAIDRASAKVR